MEVNNIYRRTKEKLDLLKTTDAPVYWVLCDLVDLIDEVNGEQPRSEESKLMLSSILKTRYLQYIRSMEPDDPSQTKLFRV